MKIKITVNCIINVPSTDNAMNEDELLNEVFTEIDKNGNTLSNWFCEHAHAKLHINTKSRTKKLSNCIFNHDHKTHPEQCVVHN